MNFAGKDFILKMFEKLQVTPTKDLLRQISEYLRQLDNKPGISVVANETARSLICIDLAAASVGVLISESDLIKLSTMRKPNYIKAKRTIEKVLDIQHTLGVKEICTQLGVNEAQNAAQEILKGYRQFQTQGPHGDITHPQYAAMAVSLACQKFKIKVPKANFLSLSQLNASQWKMLEQEFQKALEKRRVAEPEVRKALEEEEAGASYKPEKEDSDDDDEDEDSEEEQEDYQVWKARMIKMAREDLARQAAMGVDLEVGSEVDSE